MASLLEDNSEPSHVIIFKRTKEILDNITTENLPLIVLQLKQLKINTIKQLSAVVEIIYESITEDLHKIESYAYVCQHLSTLVVPVLDNLFISFKYVLLAKLGKEFEKDYSTELQEINELKKITMSKELETEMKKMLSKREEKIKKQILTVYRLSIELYKVKMIRVATIHRILSYLLQRCDEFSLECLCVMLISSCKILYLSEKRNRYIDYFLLNSCFCDLHEVVENIPISQRMQLLLEDIINLQSNNWDTTYFQTRFLNSDTIQGMFNTEGSSSEILKRADSLSDIFSSCPKTEVVETRRLFKRVKKYLKNLTLEDASQLLSYITKEAKLDNLYKLLGIVRLIYEKAIEDSSSAARCAYICKQFSAIHVPLDSNEHLNITFQYVLLAKCQAEFEKSCRYKLSYEENFNAVEDNQIDIKTDREDLEKIKIRWFRIGNIKFLCELFEMQIISDFIMHDIIKTLLRNADDLSLECLCYVLVMTGKDLETSSKRRKYPFMLDYFYHIMELFRNGNKIYGIQEMLKEAIDVMCTNWSLINSAHSEPNDKQDSERDDSRFKNGLVVQKVKAVFEHLQTKSVKNILLEIMELNIYNENKLQIVVDILYVKAISDAAASIKCATICKELFIWYESKLNNKNLSILLKKVLLTKCIHELMKYYNGELQFEELHGEIEIKQLNEKIDMKQMADEEEIRENLLSTTIFILDLYKVDIVNNSTMHNVVNFLLQKEEILIECACLVLLTIGKKLEHDELHTTDKCCLIDNYFSTIHTMLNNMSLSLKIVLMMQEVIDLRSHKWIPSKIRPTCCVKDMFWKEQKLHKEFESIFSSNLPHNSCPSSTSSLITLLKGKELETVKILEKVEDFSIEIKKEIFPKIISQLKLLTKTESVEFVAVLIYERAKTFCHKQTIWAKLCKKLSHDLYLDSYHHCFKEMISKTYLQDMISMCSKKIKNTNHSEAPKEIMEGSKVRKEMLGGTKFILKLFNLQMASTEIIHRSINLLLEMENEVSIECICIILKTTGKILENEKMNDQFSLMDRYFCVMQKILHNNLLKKRVMLMVKEVIDLRCHKWMLKKDLPCSLSTDICSSLCKDEKNVETNSEIDLKNEILCNLKASQLPECCDIKNLQDVDIKTKNLLKKFKKILDDITIKSKIPNAAIQITSLNIITVERLEYLFELIYEKVVCCSNAVSLWAFFCNQIFLNLNKKKSHQYRNIVVKICQQELKKLCCMNVEDRKRLVNIKSGSQKRQVSDPQEVRSKVFGNIMFTAELFKLKMVDASVIHSTIKLLLHWENEVSVDCVCAILHISGKDLEKQKITIDGLYLMDHYIRSICEICSKSPINRRILVMVGDIINLRKHNWIPHEEHIVCNVITGVNCDDKEQPGMPKADGLEHSIVDCISCHNLRITSIPPLQGKVLEIRNLLENVSKLLRQLKILDFSLFLSELKKIKILTKKEIEYIAILIYEAVICPVSAVTCAKLCHQLSTMQTQPNFYKQFTRQVSNICIQEFKKNCYKKVQIEEAHIQIKYSENASRLLELIRDLNKIRMQMQRTVIFIMEMFVLNVIKESVISTIIENLLQTPDQISMECLIYIITKEEDLNFNIKKDECRVKNIYFSVVDKLMKTGLRKKIHLIVEDIESVLCFYKCTPMKYDGMNETDAKEHCMSQKNITECKHSMPEDAIE